MASKRHQMCSDESDKSKKRHSSDEEQLLSDEIPGENQKKDELDPESILSDDDENIKQDGAKSEITLMEAFTNKEYKIAEQIIRTREREFDALFCEEGNTIHIDCAVDSNLTAGAEEVLELLLKHPKCDINAQLIENKTTALHQACTLGSAGSIQLILGYAQCDITLQSEHGATALYDLIGHYDLTTTEKHDILREFSARSQFNECARTINKWGYSVLDRFLLNQKFHSFDTEPSQTCMEMLDILLTVPGLVTLTNHTLALAATFCSPAVFKRLLEEGADVNSALPNNETTMHCIVQRNSVEKCRIAMERNPDITIKWIGFTALELAAENRSKPEIAQMLGINPVGKMEQKAVNVESVCKKWSNMKDHIKSKLPISFDKNNQKPGDEKIPVVVVKNNQTLIKYNKEETEEVKTAINALFSHVSQSFAKSSVSFMAFRYFLSGSMAEETRCFAPDEFDVMCVFTNVDGLVFEDANCDSVRIKPKSGEWINLIGDTDNDLDQRLFAQKFYYHFDIALKKCVSDGKKFGKLDIPKNALQYMDKISRLQLFWRGDEFTDLKIHVDVVLSFVFTDHTPETPIPLGVECPEFYVFAKASRHDTEPNNAFLLSYCRAEKAIMLEKIPRHVKEGFIYAKSMRLASICGPGLDLKQLKMVEDLSIDDYLTSYLLKTCLYNFVQRVDESEIEGVNCAFKWAEAIYRQFERSLEARDINVWYEPFIGLVDCVNCQEEENSCCKKMEIRLALTRQILNWIETNSSVLHDGAECAFCSTEFQFQTHEIDVEEFYARAHSMMLDS